MREMRAVKGGKLETMEEKRDQEMTRRGLEIVREMRELEYQLDVIKARLTKEIWTDERYSKERLRQAELTLRLDADMEARDIRERMKVLMKERDQLRAEQMAWWHRQEREELEELQRRRE